MCYASAGVIKKIPVTSLMYPGSGGLLVDLAHLSSGVSSRVCLGSLEVSAYGECHHVGGSTRLCSGESNGLRESDRFCLGESNDFHRDTCALTSPCSVAHVSIATVITENTAAMVYSYPF